MKNPHSVGEALNRRLYTECGFLCHVFEKEEHKINMG